MPPKTKKHSRRIRSNSPAPLKTRKHQLIAAREIMPEYADAPESVLQEIAAYVQTHGHAPGKRTVRRFMQRVRSPEWPSPVYSDIGDDDGLREYEDYDDNLSVIERLRMERERQHQKRQKNQRSFAAKNPERGWLSVGMDYKDVLRRQENIYQDKKRRLHATASLYAANTRRADPSRQHGPKLNKDVIKHIDSFFYKRPDGLDEDKRIVAENKNRMQY